MQVTLDVHVTRQIWILVSGRNRRFHHGHSEGIIVMIVLFVILLCSLFGTGGKVPLLDHLFHYILHGNDNRRFHLVFHLLVRQQRSVDPVLVLLLIGVAW